jgi:hypothetical protein
VARRMGIPGRKTPMARRGPGASVAAAWWAAEGVGLRISLVGA